MNWLSADISLSCQLVFQSYESTLETPGTVYSGCLSHAWCFSALIQMNVVSLIRTNGCCTNPSFMCASSHILWCLHWKQVLWKSFLKFTSVFFSVGYYLDILLGIWAFLCHLVSQSVVLSGFTSDLDLVLMRILVGIMYGKEKWIM